MHDEQPRATAYHEAGHAVAFWRLWPDTVNCGGVTIAPTGDSGRHLRGGADDVDDPENEAMYCYAGWAAVLNAGLPNPEAGCDDDFAEGRRWCRKAKLYVGYAKREARILMGSTQNRSAVRMVAEALLRRGELDSQELRRLIHRSDSQE